MSLNNRIHELQKKHEALSALVERAHRSPGADDLHIAELKKQKMRLKEEIGRLNLVS